MQCQCETNHCPHHMEKPCGNTGTVRVSPAYVMCGPCAEHWKEYGRDYGAKAVVKTQEGRPESKSQRRPLPVTNKAIWSKWEIKTLPEGMAEVEYRTNDNDDDGYPDPGPVTYWGRITKMQVARDIAGCSRVGYYGQAVEVYLDGVMV